MSALSSSAFPTVEHRNVDRDAARRVCITSMHLFLQFSRGGLIYLVRVHVPRYVAHSFTHSKKRWVVTDRWWCWLGNAHSTTGINRLRRQMFASTEITFRSDGSLTNGKDAHPGGCAGVVQVAMWRTWGHRLRRHADRTFRVHEEISRSPDFLRLLISIRVRSNDTCMSR